MHDWPRYDVTRIDIGAAHHLDLYRRDDRAGQGWCVSLYAESVEVLRFDLFPGKAHQHFIGMPGQPRLYLPRRWQANQLVRLVASNLNEHARPACVMAGVPAPPARRLERAARQAKRILKEALCE